MRNLTITLGVAAIAISASLAHAAPVAPFDYSYDGDALPQNSTPAFTANFDSPPTISESFSGSILMLSTSYGTDRMYRLLNTTYWNPGAAGSTAEVRVKLDSVSPGASGAGDFTLITGFDGTDGGKSWTWQFTTTGIVEQGGNGSLLYADLPGGLDPTDGFHTFRFVVTGKGGPASVYIDGNTTAAYTWSTGGVPNGSRIDWGDNLGTSGGTMEWDYIQWTNAGAFAPVPEPGALSLLGLGGLAMIRRRRK